MRICDVRHPIVGVDVADAKEVEAVEAKPSRFDVAEETATLFARTLAQQLVTGTEVHTLVGWGAEGVARAVGARWSEREAIGHGRLEREGPARGAGEIVGEIERHVVALVRGTRQPCALVLLASGHDGERQPGICAGDKLTEEFEVNARGIAARHIATVIDHAHIVHAVGDEVVQGLVVGLHREAEGAAGHTEGVVAAQHEMDGALRLDVAVERDGGEAVDNGRIAQLLVEGRLVVETRGGAEGPVVAESRQQTNGEARRDEGLLVPRPMAEAHTIRQIPQTDLVLIAPSVLREEFEAVGRDAVLRTLGKDEHELFGIVGQGIAHGVAHLPLAGMLADVLVLPSETGLQRMAVEFRAEAQPRIDHSGA